MQKGQIFADQHTVGAQRVRCGVPELGKFELKFKNLSICAEKRYKMAISQTAFDFHKQKRQP